MIAGDRFDYNHAIVHSQNDQLLLNLVRLRYQDTVFFMDVASVVASYQRGASASVSPTGVTQGAPFTVTGSLGGTWTESPTISYAPLQGEEYALRFLAPIQPSAILLLSRSGWGLERLLVCTVQQINDLLNASAVGGVAPARVIRFERFHRLAWLLRALQEEGHIQLSSLTSSEKGPTDVSVVLGPGPIPMDAAAEGFAEEAAQLLNLAPGESFATGDEGVAIHGSSFPRKPTEISMSGRSVLGVMTFLAQNIDVPKTHIEDGLVRITLGADGKPFDWGQVSRGLFHVRSGTSAPRRAFVKVYYRDHWFWIEDSDLEAKSTYTLMGQIFSLQSASGKIAAPVLTIPVQH